MSVRYAADCGYVVEIEQLAELLSEADRAEFQQLLDDLAWTELEDFLKEKLPRAHIDLLFSLGKEDIAQDLDTDVCYAVIDEAALYSKQPAPFLEELMQLGTAAVPTLEAWATRA